MKCYARDIQYVQATIMPVEVQSKFRRTVLLKNRKKVQNGCLERGFNCKKKMNYSERILKKEQGKRKMKNKQGTRNTEFRSLGNSLHYSTFLVLYSFNESASILHELAHHVNSILCVSRYCLKDFHQIEEMRLPCCYPWKRTQYFPCICRHGMYRFLRQYRKILLFQY